MKLFGVIIEVMFPELQADVDVLQDMLMSTENKQQRILTQDEKETIIRAICTE